MKKNIKYIIMAALFYSGLFLGCKKINQSPLDALSTGTTFVNEYGFQTYAWQFYAAFPAYDNPGIGDGFGTGSAAGGTPYSIANDANSDMLAVAALNSQTKWISQLQTIPVSDGFYNSAYSRLRTIYIMLANIDNSPLSDEAKNHWRAVCFFFRAYNYADLINLYGDVPYVSSLLTDTSRTGLYQARTPRDVIAKNILNDLNYAVKYLRPKSSGLYIAGSNAVDPDAALALISRFGLREGTWRKYHNLSDQNTYLQASADACAKLMAAFPTLTPNYDDDFNSDNLAGVPGIIMFKAYGNNGTLNVAQGLTGLEMSRLGQLDLTRAAMDQYLCTDGQTRFTSPLFIGDKNKYDEFRNRDRRLYYTVPPPYKVVITNTNATSFSYTNNPIDTSYFGFMDNISDPVHKTLPTRSGGGQPGTTVVVGTEPNFYQSSLYGQVNWQNTYTGYRLYKYANHLDASGIGKWADAPIFRMGEILVNYAEAMFELGQFNQSIADATINKTRARGGIASLNLGNIPNDPSRDAGVDPVLWEIRRERNIELMGEGFRFNDLRRWKKMEYATKLKLGMYITKGADDIPANSIIPIQNNSNQGYVSYEPAPPSAWPDYYYLYPIPSLEIAINPKIVQNPGWK